MTKEMPSNLLAATSIPGVLRIRVLQVDLINRFSELPLVVCTGKYDKKMILRRVYIWILVLSMMLATSKQSS